MLSWLFLILSIGSCRLRIRSLFDFSFRIIFIQLKYFHIYVGLYNKVEVSFPLTRQSEHLSN